MTSKIASGFLSTTRIGAVPRLFSIHTFNVGNNYICTKLDDEISLYLPSDLFMKLIAKSNLLPMIIIYKQFQDTFIYFPTTKNFKLFVHFGNIMLIIKYEIPFHYEKHSLRDVRKHERDSKRNKRGLEKPHTKNIWPVPKYYISYGRKFPVRDLGLVHMKYYLKNPEC